MSLSLKFNEDAAKQFFLGENGKYLSAEKIYSYSREATVQRGYVYRKDVSEEDKISFWSAYAKFMDEVVPIYSDRTPNDDEHLSIIESFIELASTQYSYVLADGALRFGSAQKLINLSLKFFWVTDKIKEPPHIPVDSYIANNVGKYDYKWTKSKTKKKYMEVIERCRCVSQAYGLSLAQWELLYWNMAVLSAGIK